MIREEMKKALPAFKAYADGKIIQLRKKGTVKWVDFLEDDIVVSQYYEYRIKPEPKYRPFENQEECWNEMHKHPDFGWVVTKNCKVMCHISSVYNALLIDYVGYSFDEMYQKYEFTDGEPFGIKVE